MERETGSENNFWVSGDKNWSSEGGQDWKCQAADSRCLPQQREGAWDVLRKALRK